MQGLKFCEKLAVIAMTLSSFQGGLAEAQRGGDPSRWATLTNAGGWAVRYPASMRVGSCRQCPSPTKADLVTITDPATGGMVIIEKLADKPASQSSDEWLEAMSRDTVANPPTSQEWSFVDGQPALRVRNRNPDSTESENIYISNGRRTFAIRASGIKNATFYSLYQQMLSTFRIVGSAGTGRSIPGKPAK